MPLKNRKQRTGEAGDQGVPARAVAGENYILGWTDFFLPVWFGEVSITNSLGGREHCHCPHCPLLGTATEEPAPFQNTQLLLEASAWYPASSFHSPLQLDAAIRMSLGRRMWAGMTCSPWLLSSCFPGKGVDTLGAGRWARPPGRAFPWTCFLQDCEEIPSLLLPLPPHMRSQHSLCYVTQSGVHQTY